jgi:hypothetical protein
MLYFNIANCVQSFDHSFIPARLLFYCTYGTNLDFNDLFCNYDLAEIINAVRTILPAVLTIFG